MEVRVRLFAAARDLAKTGEVRLELPPESTVAGLRAKLLELHPELAPLAAFSLFALNAAYAAETAVVPPGAEAALIPPVSGG